VAPAPRAAEPQGKVPLLYQPGESWLYDTCSALQGVLIAQVSGWSRPDFLAERISANHPLDSNPPTDTTHRLLGISKQWATPPE
jgi:hypothetical protein